MAFSGFGYRTGFSAVQSFPRKLLFVLSMALLVTGCASTRDSSAVPRHTIKEIRDRHVVKQQLDYSCGAAALATLLLYYFGEEASEKDILDMLQRNLTEEERQRKAQRGFSLLDLKRVARDKGYQAAGFRLRLSQLPKLAAPVIVFLEPQGYKHFAVLRGIQGGRVFLADPARGNLRMSIDHFEEEWREGIVFVLGREGSVIQNHALALPHPWVVQPEISRVHGHLDIGASTRNLPYR